MNMRSASFDWQYAFHGPYDLSPWRSSNLMRRIPNFAAALATVVTLGEAARCSAGINSPVSANGPRKFVPNCSSNPSAVVSRCGTDITPALFTNRLSLASPPTFAANDRTDCRLARSNTSARTLA
jgi:hypothetical protein